MEKMTKDKPNKQCDYCNNENEDSYLYWHGDIEEDYDMGNYTCLCEDCFGTLNKRGKIKWSEQKEVR